MSNAIRARESLFDEDQAVPDQRGSENSYMHFNIPIIATNKDMLILQTKRPPFSGPFSPGFGGRCHGFLAHRPKKA